MFFSVPVPVLSQALSTPLPPVSLASHRTDGVGRSGFVGVSGVSGISGSVGVSGKVGISGSVGCSGSVGVSGSSGGFLRSVISIFTKFPFSGTVKEMDSASSYPSGADISSEYSSHLPSAFLLQDAELFPDIRNQQAFHQKFLTPGKLLEVLPLS